MREHPLDYGAPVGYGADRYGIELLPNDRRGGRGLMHSHNRKLLNLAEEVGYEGRLRTTTTEIGEAIVPTLDVLPLLRAAWHAPPPREDERLAAAEQVCKAVDEIPTDTLELQIGPGDVLEIPLKNLLNSWKDTLK